MKNTILLIGILFSTLNTIDAQIAIGKSAIDNDDAILDFPTGTTNGIILPKVTTLTPQLGTLVFDANTNENKVKYFNGTWMDLSIESGTSDITDQSNYTEVPTDEKGLIIGNYATGTNVKGVLILEATDKSLVLPKIASPHLNVKSPAPGMICYDTDHKLLAVYNGSQWTFWSTELVN